jgi:hypothetical protein
LSFCTWGAAASARWPCQYSGVTGVEVYPYVLANVGIADKELSAQVLLGDDLVICECDGAYASENKILGDFVGESLDRDEENVGGADSVCVSVCTEKDVMRSDFSCA